MQRGGLIDSGLTLPMPEQRPDEWYAISYFKDGSPAYTGPVKSDKASAITAVAMWHSLAGWRAHDVLVFMEDRQ